MSGSDTLQATRALIDRTCRVLDEETETLRKQPGADVSGLSDRKNRCLFELNLALRNPDFATLTSDLGGELRRLAEHAERNAAALRASMAAAGEVIAMLNRQVEQSTEDGIYSRTRGYSAT